MRETRKYTEEEKQQILQEVKETGNMAAVAKKNMMPVGTIYTWIKPKNKGKKTSTKNPTLEEISSLKDKLKDSELENKILKELLKKTYQIWNTE